MSDVRISKAPDWIPGLISAEYRKYASMSNSAIESDRDPGYTHALNQEEPQKIKSYDPAKDPKFASKKISSLLDIHDSVTPQLSEKATQEHDYEIKALAKELQSMHGHPAWNPNSLYKD